MDRSWGRGNFGRWSAAVLIAGALAAGCTGPWGRRWDFDLPTARRVGRAALGAALSPSVLAPAVGASIFAVDDWDHKVSDWARDETPIYGGRTEAGDWSDVLRDAAEVTALVAAVATPTGPDFTYKLDAKAVDVGAGVAAWAATAGLTGLGKSLTARERPDGSNDSSLPSAHASATAVAATLSRRYVDHLPIPRWGRWPLHGAFIAWPYAVGWARVEGGRHYPSDALAGIALGNFMGMFVNELLEVDPDDPVQVTLAPSTDGLYVGVGLRW